MSNVKAVHISGYFPECCFGIEDHKARETVLSWIGAFNLPGNGGIKIDFIKTDRKAEVNKHGGTDTFIRFLIHGEEAYRWEGLVELARALAATCKDVQAQARDVENGGSLCDLLVTGGCS